MSLSKPPVPAAGIPVARPMFLVGLAHTITSIDWHMQVNQLLMNYTWSNITFDSVALENLAPGDAMSAQLARPLSLSSANNMWQLFYNRSQDRLLLKNVTHVMGSQAEVDYYMYWATVYHSKLPYFKAQAQFIQDVIKIRLWRVSWQSDTAIRVIKCYSGSCRVEDSVFQLQPVVFRRMPSPPALGPDLKLRPAEKSALVTSVGDPQTLRDQLRPLSGPEAGRPHVVLLHRNVSLQPLFAPSNATSSGTLSDSDDANNSTSSSNAAAAAAAGYVPPGMPATGVRVTAPLSIVGDLSKDAENVYASTVLDLAFARGLLDATEPMASGKGQLQLQHLRLRGLSQGPAAAAAANLQSAQVWSLLGWAFRRSAANDVALSGCMLELPPPEFERLAMLAQQGGGQVVLRLEGDLRGSGDGLVVLNGVMDKAPQFVQSSTGSSSSGGRRRSLRRLLMQAAGASSNSRRLLDDGYISSGVDRALWVETMSAQGLSGSKLVLVPAEGGMRAPGGYFWPGGASAPISPVSSAARMSGAALAAAVAVPIIVAAVLVASTALFVVSRRRQRQRQQQQSDKNVSTGGHTAPGSGGSSSSFGSARMSGDSDSKGSMVGVALPGSGRCRSIGEGDQQQSLRASMDVAAVDQDHQQADASCGKALLFPSTATTKADAGGGRPASAGVKSASEGTQTTIDSAHSLSQVPPLCADAGSGLQRHRADQQQQGSPATPADAAGKQQQQQPASGLSHRLTSAISHLQHDITRRRITGGRGSGSQQQLSSSGGKRSGSDPAGSSGDDDAAGATPSRQPSNGSNQAASQRQDCRVVAVGESGAGSGAGEAAPELQVLNLIGRGSFAAVYRAIWRGRCVALKVVQLPASAAGNDELSNALQTTERMAVMEAVVSVTMSHPNIVQVYTFALQPLFADDLQGPRKQLEAAGSSPPATGSRQREQEQEQQQYEAGAAGWELQLTMEWCEEGSLRAALNQQRLVDPASPSPLPAVHLVLALAHDVACAMLHLHEESIVHSDLKASNVLLTKGNTLAPLSAAAASASAACAAGVSAQHQQHLPQPPAGARDSSRRPQVLRPQSCAALLAAAQAASGGRLVAKVADFGLSLALDPESTHISHMHAGTLTHMSPELLLDGHASKASDCYAFGILLWELATGGKAFKGLPVALVGHNVTQLGLRPPWVPGVSPAIKQLVEACWAQDPAARPGFSTILARLEDMLLMTPDELCPPASGGAALAASEQLSYQLQQQQQQQQHQHQQQVPAAAYPQQQQSQAVGSPQSPAGPADAGDSAVTGDWTM